ncbi:MAG: hypothetical protein O3C43_12885 [Verrucomicrobia bacterium]|nr:hypothetical protein [Verrucomicrobiota bacterium]
MILSLFFFTESPGIATCLAVFEGGGYVAPHVLGGGSPSLASLKLIGNE